MCNNVREQHVRLIVNNSFSRRESSTLNTNYPVDGIRPNACMLLWSSQIAKAPLIIAALKYNYRTRSLVDHIGLVELVGKIVRSRN